MEFHNIPFKLMKKLEVSTYSHICYLTDIPSVCLSKEAIEDIELKGMQ